MKNQFFYSRRNFLKYAAAGTSVLALPGLSWAENMFHYKPKTKMKLGLVTYLWAKDWDIPTIITNCEKTNILGVELRVEHRHGVTPEMSAEARKEVKKRFKDSKVNILGMGTNQQYDYPDQDKLKASIERTKEYIRLSHDIGGSGVKVKPNELHTDEGIPKEKTLEQIGNALNHLAIYAKDYGQAIRLEVHGKETQELPNIKMIMDAAPNRNVGVCWNCNEQDLDGQGLEYNFNLVKDRLGKTVHVREMNIGDYPYQELMNLFVKMDYDGWILLECRTDPPDKVKAMMEQRQVWEKMIENANKV